MRMRKWKTLVTLSSDRGAVTRKDRQFGCKVQTRRKKHCFDSFDTLFEGFFEK
jgi:hypothetical protein